MKPYLWEILFKIILVSAALFRLDWRVAIITIVLLSTPLYVPKLIEDRLQSAQTAYLKAMEDNLTKVTGWRALRSSKISPWRRRSAPDSANPMTMPWTSSVRISIWGRCPSLLRR